jgi:hypothetical protein
VVYDGQKLTDGQNAGAQVNRFFGIQGDPNFRGGCRATIGDIDGDGFGEVIISAGFGGGPRIAIFDGEDVIKGAPEPKKLVGDFFAFEKILLKGAFLTAGDVNGDGFADLAFGGGPDGGPRVRVIDGKKLLGAGGFENLDQVAGQIQLNDFIAGTESNRGGVRVALRDVNGDGQADLITGSGDKEASGIRLYDAMELLKNNTNPTKQADPFGGVLANGVFVG